MNVKILVPGPETLRTLGIGGAVALVLGIAIPTVLLPDGTRPYPPGTPERAVAEEVRSAAWREVGGFGRLVYLHARVSDVLEVPYHCPDAAAPGDGSRRDLAAQVRLYTWFGVPAGTLHARCGGAQVGRFDMPVSRPDAHPLIGTWIVASWACPGGCALDSAEAGALLGRRARYSSAEARFHDTGCGPVAYVTRAREPDDFAADYGVTPAALGLDGERVMDVEVRCDGEAWVWPGGRVALVGPDRALLPWDGALFTLVRERDGLPPAPPGDEECPVVSAAAPTLVAFFGLPDETEADRSAPPEGLQEAVTTFRAHVRQAATDLAPLGVRVEEAYGPCVRVVAPDGQQTLRTRGLPGGVGFVARGLGVNQTLTGLQDRTAIVALARSAFGL